MTYQAVIMSLVMYEPMMGSPRKSKASSYLMSLWKMIRVMWGPMVILYIIVLLLAHGASKFAGGPALDVEQNETELYSPLQSLLTKDLNLPAPLLDSDIEMMKKINDQSTLELKTLVITETVVPYNEREELSTYVKQQLDASDVICDNQKEAVLTMLNLAPMEATVTKEEIGERGSLRNSAVMALIKRHLNNVHFMLIGVRAEPRLGFNWIASAERNAWNDVLSRVLSDKIQAEAKHYLCQRNAKETVHECGKSPVINVEE